MNIADFIFETKQVMPTFFQTILKAKNGNKFGIIYRSQQAAPDIAIFEAFKQNKQSFFLEVDCMVTPLQRLNYNPKLLTMG